MTSLSLASLAFLLLLTAAAETALIELDGPGGQKIFVNPREVTTLREPRGMSQQHFAPGTRCVVFMTNGNILAVSETCETIRDRIEEAEGRHS